MAYSHVQGITHTGQNTDTPTATFSAAVTSGNVVSGSVGWVGAASGTATLASVTDDKGNPYTVVGTIFGNYPNTNLYYLATFHSTSEITNAPTIITATISDAGTAATFAEVMIDEWSGFSGSVSQLGSNSTQVIAGAGNVTMSVSITSSATALVLGYAVDTASGSITAGSGFTQVQSVSATWLSEWKNGTGTTDSVSAVEGSANGGALWGFSLAGSGAPPPSPPPTPPPPGGGRTLVTAITLPLAGPGAMYFPITPLAANSANVTFVAADAVNMNYVPIVNGKTVVWAWNTGGSPNTLTIHSVPDPQRRLGDITTYSIGANTISSFGPFTSSPAAWNQTGPAGLWLDASSAQISFLVWQLP